MRPRHLLSRNKAGEGPRRLLFVDTETTLEPDTPASSYHRLRLGVAHFCRIDGVDPSTGGDWLDFTDADTFWSWSLAHAAPRERLYIIAHNVEFDFRVLAGFSHMRDAGFKLKRHIFSEKLFSLFYTKGRASVVIVDSMMLLPASLATLGDVMGVAKLGMPAWEAPDSEWFAYCRRDVDVLREAFLQYLLFIRTNDFGNFSATNAGQAFNAYRHRFMDYPIYIHSDEETLQLERDAYYGGRVECFRLGRWSDGDFSLLDVNSLYPSVMRDNAFPNRHCWTTSECSPLGLRRLMEQYYVIARVTVATAQPLFPMRYNKRLCFPTGHFPTVLHHAELQLALERQELLDVQEVAVYDCAPLFANYVDALYTLRSKAKRDGNKVYDYLLKLLLNSLYGKFGQVGHKSTKVATVGEDEWWVRTVYDTVNGDTYQLRCLGGEVFDTRDEGESYNSFPAVAGAVTSYGRVKLLEYIEKAGWENVYYCDTDSGIVNGDGLARMDSCIDATALGALKIEMQAKDLAIWGPKAYRFGDVERRKGVGKHDVKQADGSYKTERWERILSAMSTGNVERYRILYSTMWLAERYDKGFVGADGVVAPFKFSECRNAALAQGGHDDI